MTRPPPPPRKPGSQVAPGQRPLHNNGRTATTHSKIPIDQATEGKLYRVRDKHFEGAPGHLWGENLTWAEANKLKDKVVAERKTRTARVEDMAIPMPGEEPKDDLQELEELSVLADTVRAAHDPDAGGARAPNGDLVMPAPGLGAAFEIAGSDPQTVPARGVIIVIPAGHELLVDGAVTQVPAIVQQGQVAQARPLDPDLAAANAAALAAARPVAAAAQARARAPYRDKTVVIPGKRAAAPPRDRTVSKSPPFVRLGAPPAAEPEPPKSPLKVATETDGEALPDGALSDSDLHDLDVGGGPSDDDVAHAKRLRDEAARAE